MSDQSQRVSGESQAYQAAGDINIVNNDYIQIKEICKDLFELNFPQLVTEAAQKAKENLQAYVEALTSNIQESEREKIQEKLKEPRGQFLLNESISNAARFGSQIDFNILSQAIKSALATDDLFLESMFSEASAVIPRLSRNQLISILVNFYMTNLSFREEVASPPMVELTTVMIFRDFRPLPTISQSQRMHLVSLGLFTFNQFSGGSSGDILAQKYPTKYNSEMKPLIQNGGMPFLSEVSANYDANNMIQFVLTPKGSAIGLLMAKVGMPQLDPNILRNM